MLCSLLLAVLGVHYIQPPSASTSSVGYEATGVGVCAGVDSALFDSNGAVGCEKRTNIAPQGLLLRPQPGFPNNTTTAANLILAGGQDNSTITIDDYTLCEDDTVTITVINSNGTSTATVLTESELGGADWNAVTSNNQTATNLAAQLNDGTPDGVTATASSAVVSIVIDEDTASLVLAEFDGTCTTVAVGTRGDAIVVQGDLLLNTVANQKLVFAVDNDAVTPSLSFGSIGLYASTSAAIRFSFAGSAEYQADATSFASLTTGEPALLFAAGSTTVPTISFTGDTDTGMSRSAANQISIIAGAAEAIRTTATATTLQLATTFSVSLSTDGSLVSSSTNPTIFSGFGTSPTIAATGTPAFTVTVGTGGTAQTGVVTMPASTTGWACGVVDTTTPASFETEVISSTATSISLQNYSRTTGLAIAWTASDVLVFRCTGY